MLQDIIFTNVIVKKPLFNDYINDIEIIKRPFQMKSYP